MTETARRRRQAKPCRCGHMPAQHGQNRCMALLPSDEPCPCGKGYRR